MLARTASNLFWLARYMERADYIARLLQVAGRMSSVRVDDDGKQRMGVGHRCRRLRRNLL